ncbi:MAG: hypothetical protein AAF558_00060 [Verrucomicrobiota bacterium]
MRCLVICAENDVLYFVAPETGELLKQYTLPTLRVKRSPETSAIKEHRLRSAHQSLMMRLARKGIDVDRIPGMTVKIGKTNFPSLKRKSRRPVLTESLESFAKAGIKAIRKQRPEEYREFTLQFRQSCRRSRVLLAKYVLLGRDRHRVSKVASLLIGKNLRQLRRNIPSPSEMGLNTEWRPFHWRSEALAIYADRENRGAKSYASHWGKKYRTAQLQSSILEQKLTTGRKFGATHRNYKHQHRRANLRFDCQHEHQHRIRLVEQLLF